jgi:hypothetical protein
MNFLLKTLLLLAIIDGAIVWGGDVKRPVVVLTSPRNGARVAQAELNVIGTARDESGISNLFVRINGSLWAVLSTNGFTNWTSAISLQAGPNAIEVFALDKAGNFSATNKLTITYVVKMPLVTEIQGPGKIVLAPGGIVATARNETAEEIGATVRLTAAPLPGTRFVRWSGATNSTAASISIAMASNLVVRGEFVDILKPTISIRAPSNNALVSSDNVLIQGIAADNITLSNVTVIVNENDTFIASGTTNWSVHAVFKAGPNKVQAFATDAAGNRSATATVTVTCLEGLLESYWPMQAGDYKHFQNKYGDGYLRIEDETNGVFDVSLKFWAETAVSKFSYRNEDRELLVDQPLEVGPRRPFFSPYIFLDAATVARGGTKSSTGTAHFVGTTKTDIGDFPFLANAVITKIPGAVTVPAGTFSNCVRVDVSFTYNLQITINGSNLWIFFRSPVTVTQAGHEVSNSYVLAPGVGPIRTRLSWYGKPYADWFDLEDAVVNGVPIGKSSGPHFAKIMNSPPSLEIRSDTGRYVLAWPGTAGECVLESTSDLTPNPNWNAISTPSEEVRGVWTFEIPSGKTRFFRLRVK